MGRNRPKRTSVSNKSYKKFFRTKRRPKDLDQIQDELKTYDKEAPKPVDIDLPGLGQHFCLTCSIYFIDDESHQNHLRTKKHKRRLKMALEKPYSQKEAEAAAGMR